jgi:hypothetical protein
MRYATLYDQICSYIYPDAYPSTEHWAFVARGTTIDKDLFFLAQFNEDDFITKSEHFVGVDEGPRARKPFLALFTDDKETAALSIISSFTSEVWVKKEKCGVENTSDAKSYVYKNGQIYDNESEWTSMRTMKLRELNNCIYKTSCSEKEYDFKNNNSQHFVKSLWDYISSEKSRFGLVIHVYT